MKGLKKRIAAMFCVAAMIVTTIPTALPMSAEAKVLEGLSALGRQVAAEGCVLLKNENNVLPLKENSTVSVFGRIQNYYYASGLGSGGGVNTKYRVNIVQGLEQSGKVKVNSELKKIYEDWTKDHKIVVGKSWNDTPWSQEEMTVTQDVANKAKSKSDAAVVIIGRTSGENRDTAFKKGGYLLRDDEEKMLDMVTKTFDKVVVVLNVSTIIDMSWVEKYPEIDSVLYAWNGGQDGGHAVADVLTGKVNPSGKLADTIATDYKKYPTYENYGKYRNFYQEDIYVGYRYFESFAQQDVAYPFGYGLSYSTFETTYNRADIDDGMIKVSVSVKNTGDVKGKEVVQVYYGAPQAKLGNPAKELVAFAKTRELAPGEQQDISLNFRIDDMASYDDSGVTGHESCYVLEAGEYKIYVGNDARSSKQVFTYTQEKTEVTEKLSEVAAPIREFKRYKAVEKNGKLEKTEEAVPQRTTNVEEKINKNLPKELKTKDNKTYKLIDVYNGKLTMEEFVAQFTNEQMAVLVQGGKDVKGKYANGCASPFGGGQIKDSNGKLTYFSDLYGVPVATSADGPSGMKISDKGTLLPCGNAIGCTWNIELVQDLYEMEGQELILNQVDALLGPGVNIHRDPRCGRNFEYFSEDPLLAGRLAAAIAKGVQKSGPTVVAKHYAANNQECDIDGAENRRKVDSAVSERALREIYLKVFEIYVKEGNAHSLMTAYNPINECWASSHYDLNTEVLRNEWGFKGIVMSDWWAQTCPYPWGSSENVKNDKGEGHDDKLATMVRAQNDLFLPNDTMYNDKGEATDKIKKILSDLKSGKVTRAELQRSAVNLCTYLMNSQSFAVANNLNYTEIAKKNYKVGENWFEVGQAQLGNPQVTGITVDGRKVTSFNKNVLEYKVYVPADAKELPEVKAAVETGTKVEVQQATKENKVATIKATEQQATTQYRIVFTSDEGLAPILENSVLANVTDIKVNGKSVSGFDTGVYEYSVAVDSFEKEPEVVVETPEGVTAKVTYDKEKKVSDIQCTSADQARSYKLRYGVAPKSDEFNETKLSSIWTVEDENETNWKVEDGHLVIGAEKGSIWQNQGDLKNRFVQSAYGDWEAVVKIDIPKLPSQRYQSLGVVTMQDLDNYVYVKMEHGNDGLVISLCREDDQKNETVETISDEDEAKFKDTMYVKLKKLGDTYIASVSPDGKEYIRFATSVAAEYESPKFMLVNGNGDQDLSETLEAKFDYVQFKTENLGDTVEIKDGTKLKVAEVNPIAISGSLKPETCKDEDGGLNFTNSAEGEYVIYNVNVEKSGYYDLTARMASSESDTQQVSFTLSSDGTLLTNFFTNGSGGAQNWGDVPGKNSKLTAGNHSLKLRYDNANLNLNWIQFKLTKEIPDAELRGLVTAAKAIDMSAYSKEDQEAYAAAIKAAEAVLETAETKEEFDAAIAELKKAEEGLFPPDTAPDELDRESIEEELKSAIEEAEPVFKAGQGEYDENAWKVFVEAYNAAVNQETDKASAESLLDLKNDLLRAQEALAGNNPGANPDLDKDVETLKAELADAVKAEEATIKAGRGEYTEASWKRYENAYNAAVKPAEAADAETLAKLKAELNNAKAALVKEGEPAPVPDTETDLKAAKEAAETALQNAAGIYNSDKAQYTEGTWKKFKAAYEAVEDALKAADVTAEKLTKCKAELVEAQDALEKVSVSPAPVPDPNPTQDPAPGVSDAAAKLMDQVKVTLDISELYAGGNADNKAVIDASASNGVTIQSVTYRSTNEKAATVNTSGEITAKKKGKTTIAATVTLANGETKTFYFDVTVNKAYIEGVNVQGAVKAGKKKTLKAVAHGSSKKITWKLKSGSKYAKITKKGKLTAKAQGKVKVVAKSGKISKTFTIRIK